MSKRSGLSCESAAVYGSDYVELTLASCNLERSNDFVLNYFVTCSKVSVQVLFVYCDVSGTGNKSYSGYRRLSSACALILHLCHLLLPPFLKTPELPASVLHDCAQVRHKPLTS